jgi:oligopeptide/dipeptide ABC transporter ATP-binding protein
MDNTLLEVKDLKTHFFTDEGIVRAVDGADFSIHAGETLGIVGESGCGKTVTAYSILQLIEKPGRIVEGQILFRRGVGSENGHETNTSNGDLDDVVDLAALNPRSKAMREIRGGEIAMIFQEPMNSLSPVHSIGDQIVEAILLHRQMSKHEAWQQAIELLRLVGIPNPERRIRLYTFQLSGGMRQRAMIAMALACRPSLLIADEPTTALDVTTQAQIIELIRDLQQQFGMAMILITHDLGVVAEICDRIVVMYLGEVVEQANADDLFHNPLHPYTQALLRSIPRLGTGKHQRLDTITGSVPDPYNRPTGCPFFPRCEHRIPGKCDQLHPPLLNLADGRSVRCVLYEEHEDRS